MRLLRFIGRFIRALLARTRESYAVARWAAIVDELARVRQQLSETEAALRVAEAENRRLWLLSELHETRIETGLALNARRKIEARVASDVAANAKPDDTGGYSIVA